MLEDQFDSPEARRARERPRAEVYAGQPASFWIASLACVALIVGGVAQWATAFGFMALDGTRMHGWNEVAVGIAGLAMLGLHMLRGLRLPLLIAAVGGALGALQAIQTLAKISSGGKVTVLGVEYRYVEPAWGLYLVLAGAIALACSAALAWLGARGTRQA